MISLLEDLEKRGLLQGCTNRIGLEKALREKIVLHVGVDPTGPDLHVGHLLPLITLSRFQRAGHQGIVVLGGATAQIGDPSGKKNERELLSEKTTQENGLSLSQQILKIFPGTELTNNLDWVRGLNCLAFLRDIGKHFSIGKMLARESVASRLKTGISFTEFAYQILQAQDFAHLAETKGSSLQIGGSDQWGNIVAGTELVRKTLDREVFGLTTPLLTNPDGSKMGKTAAGKTVWLTPQKTSPFEFFQFWRQMGDPQAEDLLLKLSLQSVQDVERTAVSHWRAPEDGGLQERLASEMTKLVHGADAAEKAAQASRILFGKSEPNEGNIEALTQAVPPVEIPAGTDETTKLALALGLSKSQVRRDLPSIRQQQIGNITIIRKGKRSIALARGQ